MTSPHVTNGRRALARARPARVAHGGAVWLQTLEAAAQLGVTRGRVYQLATAGRLRSREVGGLLYVMEKDAAVYAAYLTELRRLREAFAS